MDYKSMTARGFEAAEAKFDKIAMNWVREIFHEAANLQEQDPDGVDARAAAKSAAFVLGRCSAETREAAWVEFEAAQEAIRATWTDEQKFDFTFRDPAFDTISRIQFYMMTGGQETLELSADWVKANGEQVDLDAPAPGETGTYS